MYNVIENISEDISQQEIETGLRKRRRSKEANEVFVNAVTWLVTDAIAAKASSEKGYITVGRNAALYAKKKARQNWLSSVGL